MDFRTKKQKTVAPREIAPRTSCSARRKTEKKARFVSASRCAGGRARLERAHQRTEATFHRRAFCAPSSAQGTRLVDPAVVREDLLENFAQEANQGGRLAGGRDRDRQRAAPH